MEKSTLVERAWEIARERYAALGVDADAALVRLGRLAVSIHCWQGDDVGGFETPGAELSGGGIQTTGNYPGRARTIPELRSDLDTALALIPGTHRLNLHASYLENSGTFVDRDVIGPEHFTGWIEWAAERELGLDFNPTCFSHPRAADGFTLSHSDPGIRAFWIEHCTRCREIGAEMGRRLGTPCVTNIWIPDGFKDTPVDRFAPRRRLAAALDEVFAVGYDPIHLLDSVESKLFGIGSESYVVGSWEFYLGYAVSRQKLICIDTGHFHPTEEIHDKISAVLLYLPRLLLHVSRGVRWDSDHVVTLSDDLRALASELVRGSVLERTHIGLDFFDASINRVAAWVIGTRNLLKALLAALLEPVEMLREFENAGDLTGRLAMLEECRTLPLGAIWDYYCLTAGVPVGDAWLEVVREYERTVLAKRG